MKSKRSTVAPRLRGNVRGKLNLSMMNVYTHEKLEGTCLNLSCRHLWTWHANLSIKLHTLVNSPYYSGVICLNPLDVGGKTIIYGYLCHSCISYGLITGCTTEMVSHPATNLDLSWYLAKQMPLRSRIAAWAQIVISWCLGHLDLSQRSPEPCSFSRCGDIWTILELCKTQGLSQKIKQVTALLQVQTSSAGCPSETKAGHGQHLPSTHHGGVKSKFQCVKLIEIV